MSAFTCNSCLFVSDLSPSDCASWVQAIGSILAIIVAIIVARHSAKQARESYEHARVERLGEQLGPVIALLKAAEREREQIWREVTRANYGGEWGVSSGVLSNLESIHAALMEIPVHSMPSGAAATSLIDARVWLRDLVGASKELVAKAMKADAISVEHGETYAGAGAQIELERDRLRQELVRLTLPVQKPLGLVARFWAWVR